MEAEGPLSHSGIKHPFPPHTLLCEVATCQFSKAHWSGRFPGVRLLPKKSHVFESLPNFRECSISAVLSADCVHDTCKLKYVHQKTVTRMDPELAQRLIACDCTFWIFLISVLSPDQSCKEQEEKNIEILLNTI